MVAGAREGGDTGNGEEALSGRDDNVLKLDSTDDRKTKYLNTTDFYTLKEGILWYGLCLNKAVVKKKKLSTKSYWQLTATNS